MYHSSPGINWIEIIAVAATIGSFLVAFFIWHLTRALSLASLGISGIYVDPEFERDEHNPEIITKASYWLELGMQNTGKFPARILEQKLGFIQKELPRWRDITPSTLVTADITPGVEIRSTKWLIEFYLIHPNKKAVRYDEYMANPKKFIGVSALIYILKYRSKYSLFSRKIKQVHGFSGREKLFFLTQDTYDEVEKYIPKEFKVKLRKLRRQKRKRGELSTP